MADNGAGLSSFMSARFCEWEKARKPQELKMLNNYQDMMRIDREDDTKGTGISRPQKSGRIFIGSTRGKIRSARAKIRDVLFGAGKMPFDTSPTNEDLKKFADTVEDILVYQMDEGGFKKSIKTGIDTLGTYGTGFIFGPFVKSKKHMEVKATQDAGYPQLQEVETEYPCPYFELGRTMDIYPDPDSDDVKEGRGVFWGMRQHPEYFRQFIGQDGYSKENIENGMREGMPSLTSEGSDRLTQVRRAVIPPADSDRVWFLRYFGLVRRSDLNEWRRDTTESAGEQTDGQPQSLGSLDPALDEEWIESIIQMCGSYVIKVEENPYRKGRRPVARCVYEEVEHEMWGVGIAENNEPHQRVTNAAFRVYLEGKAFALMPPRSIDFSKFEPAEDFKLFPGKVNRFRPGLTPEEREKAIIQHAVIDVSDGWERVIEMSEGFSDDDTGITKYTQGTDSNNLNKTASGISMIMSASSLPLKEVISNIDEMWIEDMVEALLDWDLEYLEPDIVAKILGPEQAQTWASIKQFGKTSFMTWKASGSQTFMAKEVLMQKLQGFLQLVLSGGEVTIPKVDITELLNQVWDAGDVGKESPVYTDEDLKKKQEEMQANQPPNPLEVKAKLDADKDHQSHEFQIVMQHLKDTQAKENAELSGGIQLILEMLKQKGSIALTQAAQVESSVDVLADDGEQEEAPAQPAAPMQPQPEVMPGMPQ
jgi:hypothetical protein